MTYKFISPQNRGVPDRIFIKDGNVFFIEFKKLGEKPTPLQTHVISDINDHGGKVFVVDNVEILEEILC